MADRFFLKDQTIQNKTFFLKKEYKLFLIWSVLLANSINFLKSYKTYKLDLLRYYTLVNLVWLLVICIKQ